MILEYKQNNPYETGFKVMTFVKSHFGPHLTYLRAKCCHLTQDGLDWGLLII